MILVMIARQLADDWQAQYDYRPVLLETFVEEPRFEGTCYKAANWGQRESRAYQSRTYGSTPLISYSRRG
ncbi:MAG: Druantia anti-phage system protein DruA [Sedimenticola sp.]